MNIKKNIAITTIDKPIVTDVFYIDNDKPKPIIIFCHGYKGFKDWGAWNILAEKFAESGFFFIKFNFSYNGGTLENPIDFPDLEAFGNNNYSKELDDLETVIDWISKSELYQKNINVKDINLIGHSRGGGIVIIKAEEDNRISKVISLSGVSDYGNRYPIKSDTVNWKKEGVLYVMNGRTKQKMPHYYQFYTNFKKNEERLNIKRAVSSIAKPHLIVHGDQDTSVLLDEAKNLKKWNTDAELEIIKNANHVFNTSHPWINKGIPKELEEAILLSINFLKRNTSKL
jgi:pimeloyl-ACP methyl ester carboxylesterase